MNPTDPTAGSAPGSALPQKPGETRAAGESVTGYPPNVPETSSLLILQPNQWYYITYITRDLGYGIEEGEDGFVFRGRETLAGKLILEPTNGGPPIYLFDDEIIDVEANS